MSKPTRPRRPLIEAIEPRLLFSATADIAVFDDGSHYVDALTHAANNLDLTQVYPELNAQPPVAESQAADVPIAVPSDTPPLMATHSLVFVDTHVANYQALVQDILNNPDNNNIEIIYLDANKDGIAQISQSVSLYTDISSIHLISHGVAGELQIGNSILTENNIAQFKTQLAGWQSSLSADADLLIYGCDLAANSAGVHLLEQLNQFTGADVAASTNLTGNTAHADWILEKNIGDISTAALINPQQHASWSGVLADVTYINTGSGGNNYALVPGDFAGQSFQISSSVTIDRFSVEINKSPGAAAQNLTLEIRDGYNGNVIGSATVSSTTLSNGTQWVNFDFPEASINAYQVYWARLSTSGSDHLIAATYHSTDVFNSGTFFNNSGGASWDLSFAVTNVAGTNNAPSATMVPTTYTATEQVAMNLHGTGISVADSDGDTLSVTLAAAVNNSQITANVGTTGVSISSGNGTKTLVVSGNPTQLNDFFNGNNGATLTYRMAANTPVASTNFTITVSDGVASASDNATINITAVNDAPVNTVPGTQNISEDTPLVFSAGNGNQISITDVDAASGAVKTTLSVNHGVLTLAGVTGLSFTTGDGTSDSSMVFTGTVTDINAALATLTYNPTANYNGTDTLTIITNDQGNTGSGGALSDTDTVTINLAATNDAPTVAQPIPDQNAPKNVAFNFTFGAGTFNDVDTGDTLTYTSQLNGGGALPAWLNFNPATRTFSGTPSNTDVGTINVDVTANDGNGGSVTDTFAIVTSANLDTNLIDTGSNNFELDVSTTNHVGQSFSVNSGNGTYVVNEVSIFTVAYGGAPQTVSVQLLDGWNGTVLGSTSVASSALAQTSKEWYTFHFGDVTLTDNTTYYIKVTSTGTDNAIKVGHFGDVMSGNVLVNGVADNAKDLAFKLTYENGSNVAPALDNPISDKAINTDAAFTFVVPGNTFSDADPLDTMSYRAHLVGRSDLDWITFDTATRQFGGTPHVGQIGTWQVELVATDNHGASTSEFFDVVVTNANTVPTPIPDQTVLEGSAYNFQFTAFNNANGHALTYTATQSNGNPLPAWFNFDPNTRTFYGTPDDGDVNVKTIKVTATDPFGASVSDIFTLTVNNLQEAPFIVNPIADQTATGHVPFNFAFGSNVAGDPDIGDSLTYSVQLAGGGALPAWLSYNAATRTFSGTPTNADAGTISIDVIATDTGNNTATDTFDIVISAGNAPPVNTVPGAQTTNEDTALVFSAGNGNAIQIADADAASSSVQVTLGVAHGSLSLAGTAGLSFTTGDGTSDASMVFTGTVANINAALATLTYLPASNYQGTDTLSINTNDQGNTGVGGAHSDADTVAISIAPVNDAPTLSNAIPDQTASGNSAFNFQIASNAFADVDLSDSLSYSANLQGGGALPAWLSFNAATRTFSGTPSNSDLGTLNIAVTANDGHGGIVSDNFNLTVSINNQAPTLTTPIADQSVNEDALFNFTVPANTFTDSTPGDSLTYTAQLNNGSALPAWLSFNNATRTFSGTPTNAEVGSLALKVIATDTFGEQVNNSFTLTILNTNDAPTLNNLIPNQHASENNPFNFSLAANTFKDIDKNDTLKFSAQLSDKTPLPDWLSFNASTQTFSGTPSANDMGSLSIQVTATDKQGATVNANFVLTVSNVNQAPTSNGIATINTLQNSAGDSIDLFAAFADREDKVEQLTYTVINNSNSSLVTQTTIDAQTGKLQLHYGDNQFGASQITVRATDTQGLSVDTSFAVNVAFVNHAPTSAGISDLQVDQNSVPSIIDLATVFSDFEDGKNLQYSLVNNTNPALLQSVQFNQAAHNASINYSANTSGEALLTLRATDSNGDFVESQFKVTVIPPKPVTPTDNTGNNGGIKDSNLGTSNPGTSNTGNSNQSNSNQNDTSNSNTGGSNSTDTSDTKNPANSSGNTNKDATNSSGIVGGGGGIIKNPLNPSDNNKNPSATDEGLKENLITHQSATDLPVISTPNQTHEPVAENFDHNRYDRIVQQEVTTKKSMDALHNSALASSLILPGEGFSYSDAQEFNAQVRKIHQEMESAMAEEQQQKAILSGLTLSLTTGILIWSLRASSLLLTLMSMLPLWRGIDPLPILEEVEKRKKDIEQQRKDRQAEDKNAKEVGYLFDNTNTPKKE